MRSRLAGRYDRLLLFFVAYSALASATSGAQVPSPVQQAMRRQVVQQRITACNYGAAKPVRFAQGKIKAEVDGTVTLAGASRTGKPWIATYQTTPGAGCELWQADLAGNGGTDLIFVQFGANSSGGWDTVLSLLLFDDEGMPFPWQATGLFSVNELGVLQLVQLGDQGKAAVIVPTQQSTDKSGGLSYHAYTFSGIRARELHGESGGTTWPVFDANWSAHPPSPQETSALSTSGQSTDEAKIQSNAPVLRGLKGSSDSEWQLVMSNASLAVPDVLVLDSATGRQIVSSPMLADLSKVQANKARGLPLGSDCTNASCHPLVLWLTQ